VRLFICAILAAIFPVITSAQSIPPAIFTDPPADAAHPAKMTVLHIPTHGLQINGLVYQPSGAGPHPTLVICHGLPGNEKFLDLAQAVRRAGWHAVTFNYRGSCADLENGFGDSPEVVAETFRLAAAAGLAGGSIEDMSRQPGRPIYGHE
jgi:hypothetical protein